jgi:ABC-type thiamin/hydroxymethylpyrimidine transport system permease subunit
MFNLLNTVNAQSQLTFSKVVSNPTVSNILVKITDNIIAPVLGLVFLYAFVVFVWGVYNMIAEAGDSGAREKGQQNVMYGVIGMVIMISAYGIIRLIAATIGVSDPFQ